MGLGFRSASGVKVDPASAATAAMLLQAASPMAGSVELVDAALEARSVVEMALAQDATVVPVAAHVTWPEWQASPRRAARRSALVPAVQSVLLEAAQPPAPVRQQRALEPPAEVAQRLEPRAQLAQQVLPRLVQAAEQQRPAKQLACAALPSPQRLSRPYPISPSLPRPLQLELVPE